MRAAVLGVELLDTYDVCNVRKILIKQSLQSYFIFLSL
jgi:hypothetical protein